MTHETNMTKLVNWTKLRTERLEYRFETNFGISIRLFAFQSFNLIHEYYSNHVLPILIDFAGIGDCVT